MSDDEEDERSLKYWKMKYEILYDDYQMIKDRSETLETRIIEMVEKHMKIEEESKNKIDLMEKELLKSNRRVEQLEEACFLYEKQQKSGNEISEVARKSICSNNGITRSEDFVDSSHKIYEYHKLPVLAKGEGFIYGFRWNSSNTIQIV